jgi:hypothetical protein
MALGIGRGADLRAPLAIAVIGGLLTATVLTLIVVPVAYDLVETSRVRMLSVGRRGTGRRGPGPGPASRRRDRGGTGGGRGGRRLRASVRMIRLAIRRPVAVTMAYVAIALLGYAAWRNVPLELLPETQLPQLSVQAEWPGLVAGGDGGVRDVAAGREIQQVAGVEKVTSTSQAGLASIRVEFRPGNGHGLRPPGALGAAGGAGGPAAGRVRRVVIPYVPREFQEQQRAVPRVHGDGAVHPGSAPGPRPGRDRAGGHAGGGA